MLYLVLFAAIAFVLYRIFLLVKLPDYGHLKLYPEGSRIFGNFFHLMEHGVNHKIHVLLEQVQEVGSIVAYRIPGSLLVIVTDPSIIRQIHSDQETFVTAATSRRAIESFSPTGMLILNGPVWHLHRKLIQPAFRPEMLRQSIPTTHQTLQTLFEKWERDGTTKIDFHRDISAYALDVIGKLAFGCNFNAINEDAKSTTLTYGRAIDILTEGAESRAPFHESLYPILFRKKMKIFFASQKLMRDTVKDIIIKRRQGGHDGPRDLLDQILTSGEDGDILSDQEIQDESVMFLIAGHETTSNTLCWILYQLDKHPEVVKKMLDEINSVFQVENQVESCPSWEQIHSLKYMDQVIKEVMRIIPTVPTTSRAVTKAVDVQDTNGKIWHLPKDCLVYINNWSNHRNPENWENPMKFHPERWSDDFKPAFGTYNPFGDGPKNCIGQRMAMIELKMTLAGFLKKYPNFKLKKDQEVTPVLTITLGPKKGMWIHLNSST